ncbi:MAG: type II toxin-antitoxin system Phd/YefM family antitoxin [Pseudonocardiaceae bacterium]
MKRFAALRTAYGALLLVVPDPVIRVYTGHRADPLTRAVTRVLGTRHLIQGLLTGGAPGALVLALGVEADLAHVTSVLGLAALDQRRRRACLADAAAAGVLAVGRLIALQQTAASWTAQRTLPAAISHRLTRDQRPALPQHERHTTDVADHADQTTSLPSARRPPSSRPARSCGPGATRRRSPVTPEPDRAWAATPPPWPAATRSRSPRAPTRSDGDVAGLGVAHPTTLSDTARVSTKFVQFADNICLDAKDLNADCTIWGMSELPISEARDHLGEIVSKAEHAQERTVLTRHGRAVAAVISIDDLRELEAAEDEADLAAAQEALATPEQRVPHREVLAEYGIA